MARIKTDIMVWSKAFLSKCKLQKWNFVTKPPHGGCDADFIDCLNSKKGMILELIRIEKLWIKLPKNG